MKILESKYLGSKVRKATQMQKRFFSIFYFALVAFGFKYATAKTEASGLASRVSQPASVKLIEVPEVGNIIVWRDHMAPGIKPTPKNMKKYIKTFVAARERAYSAFADTKFMVKRHQLESKKNETRLKLSGVYILGEQEYHFAELQIFQNKSYQQYTYSEKTSDEFIESKIFSMIETVVGVNP